mmetsp:Transcript_21734/g.28133  ORF Transcript_21734/g.28133 Transcript_21734/m.28133 type:complete len:203 (-) Transcript_21734:85-693(-)
MMASKHLLCCLFTCLNLACGFQLLPMHSLSSSLELRSSTSATVLVQSQMHGMELGITRRDVVQGFLAGGMVWAGVGFPVEAKEKAPSTAEEISAGFQQVRKEFNEEILPALEGYIKNEQWEEIKAVTKDMDLSFRKKTMGDVRKMLPKGQYRDEGLVLTNAVTFDLIDINKSARKADTAAALDGISVLKADVCRFLDIEERI